MKSLYTLIAVLVAFCSTNLNGQNLMVIHQGNGTQLQIPLESIDSIRFVLMPPPAIQKIFQNNGNVLSLAISDIDSITYTLPNVQALASVTTLPITPLSSTAALGGGTINNSSSAITQRGVCWSTSPNPTLANNFTTDGSGLGTYGSSLVPLQPATTYFVRAYAINAEGTAYGNTVVFNTQAPSGAGSLPSIATNNVVYTDGLTATCGGNITADGGLAVTARGVCWAIGTTPTINNTITNDGAGGGTFNSTLTNLLPGTSYFVRAYATNDAGTAYGITYSFTTLSLPTIETSEAVAITHFSALVGAVNVNEQSSAIIDKGICWSTSPNPIVYQSATASAGTAPGDFKKSIQGLALNTTYYARAYCLTNVGVAYGNLVSFTTLAADQFNPNINYGSVSDVDGNTYRTVVIGNREWFAENLRSSRFADGSPIPEITADSVNGNPIEQPRWCSINFNEHYDNPWGKLYNTYSIADNRNVCPAGWRVSGLVDWSNLFEELDSSYYDFMDAYYLSYDTAMGVRNKLRSANSGYWNDVNTSNNLSGFSTVAGVNGLAGSSGVYFYNLEEPGNITNPRSEFFTSATLENMGLSPYTTILEGLYNSFYPLGGGGNSLGPIRCVRSLDSLPYIIFRNYGGEPFSPGFPPCGWPVLYSLNNYSTFDGQEMEPITIGGELISTGICISSMPNPTLASEFVFGGGDDIFGVIIPTDNFQSNTTYYARAYATNAYGTDYSNQLSFTTYSDSLVFTLDSLQYDAGADALRLFSNTYYAVDCNSNSCNEITDKGICWSSSPNPTVADTMLSSGPGCAISLEQTVGGLNQGVTYYFRAYAFVAPDSVVYSNELVYSVPIDPAAVHSCGAIGVHNSNLNYGSLTDQEGNVYKTIVIGNQEWMAENLNTSIYRNGDPIENVVDDFQWSGLSTGAWCYYNNDSQYECPYGKLYNWFAVADSRDLCPAGWHIPTGSEWSVLFNYLDPNLGNPTAGGKLKSTGSQYWQEPNQDASNESGFSGLPGGSRGNYLSPLPYENIGIVGRWWTSVGVFDYTAFNHFIYNNSGLVLGEDGYQTPGCSVRCLRD